MISWTDILGDNYCAVLRKLYETNTTEQVAEHLGVSRSALRRQLLLCGIKLRPRGGAHFRVDPKSLDPQEIANMTTEEIQARTGYSAYHSRVLRRRARKGEWFNGRERKD